MSEILAIDSLKCMDLSEEMEIVKKFILNSEEIYIKLNEVNKKLIRHYIEYQKINIRHIEKRYEWIYTKNWNR